MLLMVAMSIGSFEETSTSQIQRARSVTIRGRPRARCCSTVAEQSAQVGSDSVLGPHEVHGGSSAGVGLERRGGVVSALLCLVDAGLQLHDRRTIVREVGSGSALGHAGYVGKRGHRSGRAQRPQRPVAAHMCTRRRGGEVEWCRRRGGRNIWREKADVRCSAGRRTACSLCVNERPCLAGSIIVGGSWALVIQVTEPMASRRLAGRVHGGRWVAST